MVGPLDLRPRFVPPEQGTQVRSVHLVDRVGVVVGAPRRDVHGAVRRVGHAIDDHARSDLVRERRGSRDVRDLPQQVGHVGERDDPGPRAEHLAQAVETRVPRLGIDAPPSDARAVRLELQPGPDIGFVPCLGDDDLIARTDGG